MTDYGFNALAETIARTARILAASAVAPAVNRVFGFLPRIDDAGRFVVTREHYEQLKALATYPNTDTTLEEQLFGIPVVVADSIEEQIAAAIARIYARGQILLALAEARADLRWQVNTFERLAYGMIPPIRPPDKYSITRLEVQ